MTVMTTWTSLRRPLTNRGRSGRSISRQARIPSVDGRPSRRKNEPGILPTAYCRSSTSTVRGKKSNWSLGVLPAVVVDSRVVSWSRWATTAPPAWRARRPVSNRTVRVPKRPLSMTASADWISGPSMGMPSFVEVPGHSGRSSIEVRGSRCEAPGPRATTGDRALGPGVCLDGVVTVAPGHARRLTPDQPGPSRARAGPERSATQAEPFDQAAVAVDVDLLQVAEEATPLADQEEQTTTRVVVVLVLLEVLGEVLDALREHRDLDLRGAGVVRNCRVLGHDALLGGGVEWHWLSLGTRCAVRRGTSTRALWIRGRSHGACMLSAARRGTQHERAAREQLPGPCDVVVHLRDELLDGLEADHRAQPGDELQHDLLAVQLQVVAVGDVCLDPPTRAIERRVGADRDRDRQVAVRTVRGMSHPAHPAGVDAVGRHDPCRVLAKVGRREPESPPPGISAHDDAAHPVRPAEDLRRPFDVARGQQLPHPGGRPPAVRIHRPPDVAEHLDVEAVPAAQLRHGCQVPGIAPAEADVVPHHDHPGTQTLDQVRPDEVLGRCRRELRGVRDHQHLSLIHISEPTRLGMISY